MTKIFKIISFVDFSIMWCFKINKSNNKQTVYKTLHFQDKIGPHLQATTTRPQSGPTGRAALNLQAKTPDTGQSRQS